MNPVHHFAAGVYAREQELRAGQTVETHAHKYDHLSIMVGGPVLVECDGVGTRYDKHACILIKAEVKHRITAVGDSVWFCVHGTEETDLAKIDEALIKE